MNATTPRLVLDTNVALDLLLFADPRLATLDAALTAGAVQVMRDEATRGEWRRVLGYPRLALDPARRDALAAAFDARFAPWVDAPPIPVPLPRCADPDDQRFLVLALAAGAQALITRDRALLALAGRCERAGLFAILRPERLQGEPLHLPAFWARWRGPGTARPGRFGVAPAR